MVVKLTEMKRGQVGVVSHIEGGYEFARKIQNMGIRTGKKMKKIEEHFRKGPQTIRIDNFKIAIGYGMAEKIFIETGKNESR